MSPRKILDEFSDLQISTQMRYLLRRGKRGACQYGACKEPARMRPSGSPGYYCQAHYDYHNNKGKARYKAKKGSVGNE